MIPNPNPRIPEVPTNSTAANEPAAPTEQWADDAPPTISPESPIGDYTRELQREYDEQQEEGKIENE